MVAHTLWYRQIYPYSDVLEALGGMPFDVQFTSPDDILEHPEVLNDVGMTISAGDAYTVFSGGDYWKDVRIVNILRKFIYEGGGFINVGEPSTAQGEGHFLQLYDILGMDKEVGFSLPQDRYSWGEQPHLLKEELPGALQFGEEIHSIYALPDTAVLISEYQDIRFAVNAYGKGKSAYLNGLPFSFKNIRLLCRCLFCAVGKKTEMKEQYNENCSMEVNVYPDINSYCAVDNMYEMQDTRVYTDHSVSDIRLQVNETHWFSVSREE